MIGEASDYEDEEGNLPDQIDSLQVVGNEDGFLIVNNLVLHSDAYPVYEFDKFDANKFDFLFRPENPEWCHDETILKIRETMLRFGR